MTETGRMSWGSERIVEVARAYRRHDALLRGSREQRLAAFDGPDLWAEDLVYEESSAGTLPVEVVDAMLHDPDGDAEFRSSVAAGPLERLLHAQPAAYAGAILERTGRDPLWVEALAGVWLDRMAWGQLAEDMRRHLPEPPPEIAASKKDKRSRRPSKRQHPHGHQPRLPPPHD
ncbi:hypothetical protein CLV35_2634 [Motilibacter peucedani]|uniref:Uncharacterized protein n=1 Tax=Motilibacter peucedani TaxID=598650 RepID=A0A420XPM9_9ACTN|nr:hypothetical protein [Motilibacter peucedani]RKS74132.1 hypothetical protein CLV35_2634 [Motilibacter peucedani]